MVINYVRIVLQCICKNAQFHESTLLISSDNGSILYGEDYFSACTLPENILLIIRKQCFHILSSLKQSVRIEPKTNLIIKFEDRYNLL